MTSVTGLTEQKAKELVDQQLISVFIDNNILKLLHGNGETSDVANVLGEKGYRGEAGDTGAKGAKGPVGQTGARGYTTLHGFGRRSIAGEVSCQVIQNTWAWTTHNFPAGFFGSITPRGLVTAETTNPADIKGLLCNTYTDRITIGVLAKHTGTMTVFYFAIEGG